jgi:hypothetical protein
VRHAARQRHPHARFGDVLVVAAAQRVPLVESVSKNHWSGFLRRQRAKDCKR